MTCDPGQHVCVPRPLPSDGAVDQRDGVVVEDAGIDMDTAAPDVATCALGSRTDGSCKQLLPSNGLLFDHATSTDLLVNANTAINSDKCSIAEPGLTGQVSGSMCVFKIRRLHVAKEATLSATGKNPVVILANDTVLVEGTIDVGAHGTKAGAGGGSGGTPPNSNGGGQQGGKTCGCTEPGTDDCGGGGGGHATPGSLGGADNAASCNKSSLGGGVYGNSELVPLSAGSGGASGGQRTADVGNPGAGGAGGGALRISCATTFTLDGKITAGGGGGGVGNHAGGGGGSGGGILLEAVYFGGSGVVAANGGGGGGSRGASCSAAEPGQDGKPSLDKALGGDSNCGFGDGGDGGSKSSAPQNGGSDGVGGGGGAVGRIRINSPKPSALKTSPEATTGAVLSE